MALSISILIFSRLSLSISIFFKSVDILTIDISYRYIEHHYSLSKITIVIFINTGLNWVLVKTSYLCSCVQFIFCMYVPFIFCVSFINTLSSLWFGYVPSQIRLHIILFSEGWWLGTVSTRHCPVCLGSPSQKKKVITQHQNLQISNEKECFPLK